MAKKKRKAKKMGFTRPNIEAWIKVPEKFEHPSFEKGFIEFSPMVAGADILIASMNDDDNSRLYEKSIVSTVVAGKIYNRESQRENVRNHVAMRICEWNDVKDWDGMPFDCTEESKKDSTSVKGFALWIKVQGEILDEINEGNGSEEEKNSFRWPDGLPAHVKKSTPAAVKPVKGGGHKG